jgi:hypothetical protein
VYIPLAFPVLNGIKRRHGDSAFDLHHERENRSYRDIPTRETVLLMAAAMLYWRCDTNR